MINKVSINNQEVYKKGQTNPSYKNSQSPSFKGPVELITAGLQACNTNPMVGVSVIDLATAIVPRTVVDAKTNGFAAAETFRRESSGLIVNCLIPGFIVLGIAKLMEAFNKGNKGLSGMWANQEALETLKDHYKQSDGTAKGFISRLFEDAEVLNGKKWAKLEPTSLENELSEYTKIIENNVQDKAVIEKARNNLYNKILKVTGGAEHIKIHGKVYHDNITTLLRDGVDVGQKFVIDLKKDHSAIEAFVKKATKFVNKKSLLGLAVVIPLAASMQSINRWITRKSSGQDGAPIYKNFGKGKKKEEMTPAQKSAFWSKKIGAAGLMTGVAMLSMMKKPSLKMLQFTKNMPSMDQCRWIATATFASRMLASEDENELHEVTWRDIATFSSLYFLGDYVSKAVGTIMQKVKGVPLLNYMEKRPDTKNPLKKFVYWVKDTKLKSFDEANAITDGIVKRKDKNGVEKILEYKGGAKAKGLRAICEVSSLGFSMLVLGILVPWYVRKETERKEQMKLKEKLKDFISYPSIMSTSNKKTFQAFGMMLDQSKQ
ncbi:MAG TPA: hypothetical protein IAD26_09500 [Candidatus Limenecus avicola]|uniref:Uncharacterized protein n=1 Tax=Candidatus Limenecus avicola TaxID=2840847 RepID=A0A9D1N1X9_9CLOT|nr:hypothetical protein [Candidatus Limenecus avicola]